MAKRIRIGIIYSNDENWIGGAYYIQNLIHALNTLSEDEKPQILLFSKTQEEFNQIKVTKYPFIEWQPLVLKDKVLPFWKRLVNKWSHLVRGKYLYPQPITIIADNIELLFPGIVGLCTPGIKNIYWIPDFQEQKLPHFFSSLQKENRTQSHYFIAKSSDPVIFSSNDALHDFTTLFPGSKCKTFVVNFAVFHPEYDQLSINELKLKYNLDTPYFFAPNQFWKHKNQIVILNAVKHLIETGIENFIIAFSGKEHDFRNPDYFQSLTQFVSENNLEKHVRFLGFIDRKEQLKLMQHALAIIQPSFFEGWSTVVEDAKAMQQYVIASSIAVHKEQLQKNVTFFDPLDAQLLSEELLKGIKFGYNKKGTSYSHNINEFGLNFLKIIKAL